MNDKLENFIEKNREEFDALEPGDLLWERISQTLDGDKKSRYQSFNILWRAAAVFFLIATAVLLVDKFGSPDLMQTETSMNSFGKSIYNAAPGFAEVENHYSKLISEKKSEVENFQRGDREATLILFNELDKMDSAYSSLKEKLPDTSNKQRIVDAMTENLILRISILNKQLEILEMIDKSNNGIKDEKDEGILS